ncbi:formate/nitrite transporter family protein [Pseudoteredinibacter isoporae]|uniref:Nitrite transporter NirC n=1 Tax=Pseudoteredinibacter isoporae TaxID=570281 RepID=A0A7X0JWD0_9GAMM|nr:formate/nitrite transporter family protein [Pseudoteredinibacter isoporae]MBB6522501.1 nitrite transporter NirC [Pseudoteredinibacter isoporae]NHO88030.1 nitrite transporter NirC [Pseudoteredinibacter isoporae]NIB23639.1 nitrite transporter NirC [Pseudoteredinibacter isoporae]
MYEVQVDIFSRQASKKARLLEQRPSRVWLGGILAGAYVGIGIILILVLGTEASPESRKLVMGATFAIALTLVIFAGADLFTGYTMYTTFGVLNNRMTLSQAIYIAVVVWLANLTGAVLLAGMYKLGGGLLTENADTALQTIAYKKMNATAVQLFFNGILCNWLVCLAIWMAARMNSDAAKCIAIFWCLFAFIASGYEHSVANMTVFSLALLGPEIEGISIQGAGFNLLWVTLGNVVSGVFFVGLSYWYLSRPLDVAECVSVDADTETTTKAR